jgi:SnoaL-like polyketide cyclase
MSKEQENKAIAVRWLEGFWGASWNPNIVDDLAAADILLQFSLQMPRRGRDEVKKFLVGIRETFHDLEFHSAADLVAEGDYVVGRLEGGGIHTRPSPISLSGFFRRTRAESCISRGRPSFGSTTARSQRK